MRNDGAGELWIGTLQNPVWNVTGVCGIILYNQQAKILQVQARVVINNTIVTVNNSERCNNSVMGYNEAPEVRDYTDEDHGET